MPRYKAGTIGALRWGSKGKMFTERQWYASNLHFNTEWSYPEYKRHYKKRFGK
jgi:hypothetical protein